MPRLAIALVIVSAFLVAPLRAQVAFFSLPYSYGSDVTSVGDLNGDLIDDVLVSGAVVRAYSGRDGSLIATFPGGSKVSGAGDVNGDGVPDVIVGRPALGVPSSCMGNIGRATVYSGATGATIHSFVGAPWEGFGADVQGLDDFDGDNVPDLLVAVAGGAVYSNTSCGPYSICWHSAIAPPSLRIYSGATGSLISVSSPMCVASGPWTSVSIGRISDIDGDGRDEYYAYSPGSYFSPGSLAMCGTTPAGQAPDRPYQPLRLQVFSSATGAALRSYNWGTPACSVSVDDAGDVDGDGLPDLAFVFQEVVPQPLCLGPWIGGVLYGDSTSSSLHVQSWTGTRLTSGLGDVDGDGRAEWVVSDANVLSIHDGLTGQVTMTFTPPGGATISALHRVSDLSGDGVAEIAVVSQSAGLVVYSLAPVAGASVAPLGVGCDPSGGAPMLAMLAPPVLGTAPLVQVTGVSGAAPIYLLAAAGAPTPWSPLPGCTAWASPSAAQSIASGTSGANGDWSTSVPIPTSPTLVGAEFVLQAVVGASGVGLTNGLSVLVGL